MKIFFSCYGVLLMAAVLFMYVSIAENGAVAKWIWPLFIGIKLIMLALSDTRYLYKISVEGNVIEVIYYNNWMLKKIMQFKTDEVEIACIRENNRWYGWPHRMTITTAEKKVFFEVYSKRTLDEAGMLLDI